ncbi:MAG: HAD family hydrolase [Sulfolobales archaeon]
MKIYLFIDLDNTLVINPLGRYVLPKIYDLLNKKYNVDKVVVENYLVKRNLELIKEDPLKAFDWDYILQEFARRYLGHELFEIDLVKEQHKECDKVYVFEDVKEVLEKLREESYIMILATNGLYKYQECVIEYSGLYKYFEEIRTPDRMGCLKDSKCFYDLGNIDPKEKIVKISVGDNFYFDVYSPSKYGMRTILVNRSSRSVRDPYLEYFNINYSYVKADKIITTLKDLPETILEVIKS